MTSMIKGVTVGYSAKAVANYFLASFGEHGITPLKIQKLVYLAHGWNYAFRDDDLVNDEVAEAWPYGPVFPSLYSEFKYRGNLPIINLATELELESLESGNVNSYTPEIPASDVAIRQLLDEIWRIYGGYSGSQLSEICHRPGSPWQVIRAKHPGLRNAHIPNDVIKDHYRKLYEENSNNG